MHERQPNTATTELLINYNRRKPSKSPRVTVGRPKQSVLEWN